VQQRWAEGCHNARQLYRELQARGYAGGETQVRATVRPWRATLPERRPIIPLRSLLKAAAKLDPAEQAEVHAWLEANPLLAQEYGLKERFVRLLALRDVPALEAWIEAAKASGLKPFSSVARGFRQDLGPITAALTTPWSTGQCEGQICRVKLIKRLSYGRAKPDLPRQRALHRRPVA
jgi:transposase